MPVGLTPRGKHAMSVHPRPIWAGIGRFAACPCMFRVVGTGVGGAMRPSRKQLRWVLAAGARCRVRRHAAACGDGATSGRCASRWAPRPDTRTEHAARDGSLRYATTSPALVPASACCGSRLRIQALGCGSRRRPPGGVVTRSSSRAGPPETCSTERAARDMARHRPLWRLPVPVSVAVPARRCESPRRSSTNSFQPGRRPASPETCRTEQIAPDMARHRPLCRTSLHVVGRVLPIRKQRNAFQGMLAPPCARRRHAQELSRSSSPRRPCGA